MLRLPPLGRGRRVVLGFSGGVDSAVAACALKAAGYDVLACYMRNWEEKEEGVCNADQEEKEARQLADALRIEFDRVDFTKQYWTRVFEDYLAHSADGLASPNPDVLCNREIKFDEFLAYARRTGADHVATGHYARIERSTTDDADERVERLDSIGTWSQRAPGMASNGVATVSTSDDWQRRIDVRPPPVLLSSVAVAAASSASDRAQTLEKVPRARLLRGVDCIKDQSYFLSLLRPRALDSVLFPLGALHKHEVRALARDVAHLPVWNKKGSVGICFIGKRAHGDFLSQFLHADAFAAGPIVCVQSRTVVGRHRGLPRYTIGQAARLAGQAHAYFVCGKQAAGADSLLRTEAVMASGGATAPASLVHRSAEPILWVAPGHEHPALHARVARVARFSFLAGHPPRALQSSDAGARLYCHAQFRRTPQSVPCVCSWIESAGGAATINERQLRVEFAVPQFALTPGQTLVLYAGDECLGGGVIAGAEQCAMSEFGIL